MKNVLIKIFIYFSLFCNSYSSYSQVKIFNIKNYGATGNGVKDDYNAIIECYSEAIKYPRSKIIIPYGDYVISKPVIINCNNQDLTIEGIKDSNGKIPNLFNFSNSSLLWFKGEYFHNVSGVVRIKNLNLESTNPAYTINHPLLDEFWNYGIRFSDLKKVYMENITIKSIYGEGIHISNSKQENSSISSRFDYVEIKNCKILNVWGRDVNDSYGDGIYLSNVASALIENNYIKNDFNTTKQLGRAGVVIEYMSEKCNLYNNYIFGYDRGIHIEADYGNHTVTNNKIEGIDLGITIFNHSIPNHDNPIFITNNIISNNLLPKKNFLKKTRNLETITNRALVDFVALDNSRAYSVIKGNQFIVDGNYDYFSYSILNIKADNIALSENIYTVKNINKFNKPINIYIFTNKISIENEDVRGISNIHLEKWSKKDIIKLKNNNQIHNSNIIN